MSANQLDARQGMVCRALTGSSSLPFERSENIRRSGIWCLEADLDRVFHGCARATAAFSLTLRILFDVVGVMTVVSQKTSRYFN
jgi:hypothetical protein